MTYYLSQVPPEMIEAVARCLAKQSDQFVSAAEWKSGFLGKEYRRRALAVLQTIKNVEEGNQTGGLPT